MSKKILSLMLAALLALVLLLYKGEDGVISHCMLLFALNISFCLQS